MFELDAGAVIKKESIVDTSRGIPMAKVRGRGGDSIIKLTCVGSDCSLSTCCACAEAVLHGITCFLDLGDNRILATGLFLPSYAGRRSGGIQSHAIIMPAIFIGLVDQS